MKDPPSAMLMGDLACKRVEFEPTVPLPVHLMVEHMAYTGNINVFLLWLALPLPAVLRKGWTRYKEPHV